VSPDGTPSPKLKKPAQLQSNAPLQPAPPVSRNFFGFGNPPPRQVQPQPLPRGPNVPRPPGNVGRSASVPLGNLTR
jgi:hypothetical protein